MIRSLELMPLYNIKFVFYSGLYIFNVFGIYIKMSNFQLLKKLMLSHNDWLLH